MTRVVWAIPDSAVDRPSKRLTAHLVPVAALEQVARTAPRCGWGRLKHWTPAEPPNPRCEACATADVQRVGAET